MRANQERNRRPALRRRLSSLLLLFLLALTVSACGKKTLSAKTFTDIVKTYGFSISDSQITAAGQTDWVIGKDKDGGTIQFAAFSSPGSAGTFYQAQADTIASLTGISSVSTVSVTANGYYYYLERRGDNVIFATVPSDEADTVRDILDELPDAD